MEKTVHLSNSYNETEQIGRELGKSLTGTEVIALFGGLGMGKTAFIRGLAEGLEISPDHISSPTFAIVHEHDGRVKLYHYDMYRVETWEDLDSTGFFEALGSGVVAVEWSENIENAIPFPHYKVEISTGNDIDSRIITLSHFASQEEKE